VRELENMVERLVIMSATDTIGVNDLPSHVRTPSARLAAIAAAATGTPGDHIDLAATLSRIEATLIARAMKAASRQQDTRGRGPGSQPHHPDSTNSSARAPSGPTSQGNS